MPGDETAQVDPGKTYYAPTHEWVRRADDGEWVVGISQYAAEALGDVVFVELPEPGKDYAAKDEIAVIESVKAASEVYAPLAGKVTAVNTELEENPQLVNDSPLERGWLFKMAPSGDQDLGALLDEDGYQSVCDA